MVDFSRISPSKITLDVALIASVCALPFVSEPIAVFHLVFVLCTAVALTRDGWAFAVRVLPALAATTAILFYEWNTGELPGSEVGELPLLASIVALVFVVAELKRRADARLQEQHEEVLRLRDQEAQQLTAELVQSRQQEIARDVASIVAHDINGMLARVRMEVEALTDGRVADEDERRQIGHSVEGFIDDAAATLRDLVSMTNDTAAPTARTDLNSVVLRVGQLIQRTASPHHEVETRLHDPGPLVIPVAAARIVHVTMNLARNALDAMPDGGALTITTGWRVSLSGPLAVLSVHDTGHGLPPEQVSEVFEAGVSRAPSGAPSGSGLGLYSVSQIVDEAAGTVAMDTAVGGPTVVRVEFPLMFLPEGTPAASAASSTERETTASS